MKLRRFISALITVSLISVSALSYAKKKDFPEVTTDGLHRVKDSNLAIVYAEPGADLSQYQRINMADAYVAFKKHWARDQNRESSNKVSSTQMESIKSDVAGLFRTVFTETLEKSGYELVNIAADDVLIVKPAIINLDVKSPDNRSATNAMAFSESAGEMTLYLELYDSVTGDLIAKALDPQMDKERGYMQWQNRVTNRAAASRMMQAWADIMVAGLDEARNVNVQDIE